jgi:hypothetical protein
MEVIRKVMRVLFTQYSDNNNDDENHDNDINDNIILRVLEVGLVFDYIHTVGIIKLLTSSRILLNFRGIII